MVLTSDIWHLYGPFNKNVLRDINCVSTVTITNYVPTYSYHQKYLLRNAPSLLNSLGLSNPALITSYVACRLNGYVGGYGSEDQFDEVLYTVLYFYYYIQFYFVIVFDLLGENVC